MQTNPLRTWISVFLTGIVVFCVALGAAIDAESKSDSENGNSAAAANGVPDPATFTPNKDLVFHISRASERPRIDGKLDDAMWKKAIRLDHFSEISPGENVKPKAETEAYFAYDENNFYAGFVCYDDDVDDVRATITDRDAIFRDDFVGIMIDTFKDRQNGYEFFVNPHGIQADLRRTGHNEDESYDAVWYSGGQMTDFGWTAEISIPFRSIRFPDDASQQWGLHVLRIRPRDSREQISWAPLSRDDVCLFCQAGTITGLEGINQGKNLELLPYVIGSEFGELDDTEDPNSAFTKHPAKGDAGMGLKYGITPNYTLDFAYNPDFSQIESDAAQIDVNTTFALFYPERRPFFLEGADIFDTEISTVYTRTINDPLLAGKITGKSGKTTVGYMVARDDLTPYIVPFEESSQYAVDGRSYSNIFRAKRDFLEDSFYGLIATDRRNETNGGANTNIGLDTRIRFHENYIVEAHVQGSYTREPNDTTLSEEFDDIRFGDKKQYDSYFNGEEFPGYALETGFERNAKHWNFWTGYQDYSSTFRAENGFIFSNNRRQVDLWTGYLFYTDNAKLTEILEPQFNWGREYNEDNVFKDEWIQPSIWIRFRKQTSIWAGYLFSRERFKDVYVDGIRRFSGNIDTNFSAFLSGGMWTSFGHSLVRDDYPRLGKQMSFEFWSTLKPTSQLQIQLNYSSFHMDELNGREDPETGEWLEAGSEIYDVYIVRARLSYQFTRNLYFRMIGQYVDSDKLVEFDPLLSYKLNPFTVFFIGSSHNFTQYEPDVAGRDPFYRQTDRTYFVKFQYLFRI